jgi:uncharacterized protein (DUF433 family)
VNWREQIEWNPRVMLGKPVIARTRLSVEFLLERLGAGASREDILDSYPGLRSEHLEAVIAFAAEAVHAHWKAGAFANGEKAPWKPDATFMEED